MLNKTLSFLAGILPHSRFKLMVFRWLGHELHPTAEIGMILFFGVAKLRMGANSRIGNLTALKGMSMVSLAPGARIGQLNWISSAESLRILDSSGVLELGEQAHLNNRHYLDCSGGIAIGAYTTVAGVRSTFITHGIDWKTSRQSVAPIVIGNYCLVSSNVNLTPGSNIPNRSVVGMGATVAKGLSTESSLIVAPRASSVKAGLTGEYFSRATGHVSPPSRGSLSRSDVTKN